MVPVKMVLLEIVQVQIVLENGTYEDVSGKNGFCRSGTCRIISSTTGTAINGTCRNGISRIGTCRNGNGIIGRGQPGVSTIFVKPDLRLKSTPV